MEEQSERLRQQAYDMIEFLSQIERLKDENSLRKKIMLENGFPLNFDLEEGDTVDPLCEGREDDKNGIVKN